jgi:endogenous inhibitor of DNA gyrase (YacG/DUF329 family)
MSDAILLDCPKCGRKIGIPAVSGTIHVTCPSCREQWDWPRRRAPFKVMAWQDVGIFFGSLPARIGRWRRTALLASRFSGGQLAGALIAGIAIGTLVEYKIANHGRSSVSVDSGTFTFPAGAVKADPATTNILDAPGIDPKIDESIPTNLQDLVPAKTGQ